MRKLILLLVIAIIFLACDDREKTYDWTVFIYMAADNGLTDNADEDINELERYAASSGVKFAVFVDRNEWADDSDAVLYEISSDNDSTKITSHINKRYGEVDTADPAMLSRAANDAFSRWPSHHRALIVWGHGDGWYRQTGWKRVCGDNESVSMMTVSDGELRDALLGVHGGVDILAFDACLMQTAEVISEVSDRADYVIGSVDETCTDGFPYDELVNTWSGGAIAAEMASRIVFLTTDSYRLGGSQYNPGVTKTAYSAIDTALWPAAEAAVDSFATSAGEIGWGQLAEAYEQSTHLGSAEEMIDIVEFLKHLEEMELLSDEAAADVTAAVEALQAATVYADSFGYSDDATCSMTAFFPANAMAIENWIDVYNEMRWGAATGWGDFVWLYHYMD